MKKLVIYYSLDGNTAFVAKAMAGAVEADILELRLKDEKLYSGALKKYLLGGRDAVKKNKPALLPFDKDPSDYDCLLIGTPVWAWTYAPALVSFFEMVALKDKKIGLFCCYGGSKGKALEQMQERLGGNQFIGQIGFMEPLKRNKETSAESARQWARKVVGL
jgi:flavodoxin